MFPLHETDIVLISSISLRENDLTTYVIMGIGDVADSHGLHASVGIFGHRT